MVMAPSSRPRRPAVVRSGGGSVAYARRAYQRLPAGADEAGLVGEHDELGPVAGADLDHGPADVGLGRRRAHDQPLRRSRRWSGPRRRAPRPRAPGRSGGRGRAAPAGSLARLANSSIRRRVTPGDSSASPATTARTARSSSAGSVSLTRKPLAPARIASNTYSSRSNVVRITTLTSARRSSLGDAPGGVEPVGAGHADVHQHDVGAQLERPGARPRRRRPPRRRR